MNQELKPVSMDKLTVIDYKNRDIIVSLLRGIAPNMSIIFF